MTPVACIMFLSDSVGPGEELRLVFPSVLLYFASNVLFFIPQNDPCDPGVTADPCWHV